MSSDEKNKKLRARIGLDLKKKARKMFESGMDMIDISLELKINLGSLYNISSREGWIKGKRKELIHCIETEKELRDLKRVQESIIEEYKEISITNKEILKELQTDTHFTGEGANRKEIRSLTKYRAEALSNLTKSTVESYKLDKELYGILTPEEKIKINKARLEYERLKRKLESKEGTPEHITEVSF